jgi:hypothetical protein
MSGECLHATENRRRSPGRVPPPAGRRRSARTRHTPCHWRHSPVGPPRA